MDRTSPRRDGYPPTNNHHNLNKDLDKFTRYFLIKTVQVIVQSRLCGDKGVSTECKPSGNDWFNLNITDIKEVSEQAKAVLDKLCHSGFTIKTSWRICCEISVRTNEGRNIVLELWVITNKSKIDENVSLLTKHYSGPTRIGNNSKDIFSQSNTGLNTSCRNSKIQENDTFINNKSVQNGMRSSLTEHHLHRACTSPSGPKSLLSENNGNIQQYSQTGTYDKNNELLLRDIKASMSCTSLSSAADTAPGSIVASPSINSLTRNQHQASLPSSTNHSSPTTSTIYSIYNKMSLTLKTLITTTRVSPAFQLASRGQSSNSYVVCYRIYACSPESNADTRHKNASLDQLTLERPPVTSILDIKDFVDHEESEQFSPFTKLASIRSDLNELDISFCYRTDMRDSHKGRTENRTTQEFSHRNQFNEECITAAKQLLLANNCSSANNITADNNLTDFNKSSVCSTERNGSSLKDFDRPLCAAFASEG